jgi:excisionase family DNA binding protein
VVSEHVDHPELRAPGEVAAIFRVDPKTVTRWAKQGRLDSVRTPGGQRRFYAAEVIRLFHQGPGATVPDG